MRTIEEKLFPDGYTFREFISLDAIQSLDARRSGFQLRTHVLSPEQRVMEHELRSVLTMLTNRILQSSHRLTVVDTRVPSVHLPAGHFEAQENLWV